MYLENFSLNNFRKLKLENEPTLLDLLILSVPNDLFASLQFVP